jgi:HEAT repeat protein
MDHGSSTLLLVFAPILGAWILLGVFVLGARALHDRRRLRVEAAAGLVPDPHGSRPRTLLPRWRPDVIPLLAADAAAPRSPEVTRAAQATATENRDRLLRAATGHRRDLGRWRRVAALRVLARARDPEALPLLRRALEEGDQELAGAAVDIIGSLGDRAAAEELVDALKEGKYSRSRIASQLDRQPAPIEDILVSLLDDQSAEVRFWAATLLSRHARAAGVGAALAVQAADPEPNVRAAVAESLGAARRSRARDQAVHELLRDPVWYVRVHAARSVGALGLISEAGPLAELLADREWWVRSAAKDGLEALGPRAEETLIATLDHPDRFARNGAAEILQNEGFVDATVAGLLDTRRPVDADRLELLRHVFEAGGPGLRESALARLEPAFARARLEQLLDAPRSVTEAA